jgi:hypothetical protein
MRFFCFRCQSLVANMRCTLKVMPPECPLRGGPAIVATPQDWLEVVPTKPPDYAGCTLETPRFTNAAKIQTSV